MREFWIVCCYHAYYPYGGIENISGVFESQSDAEDYAQFCKSLKHGWDYVEIYNSSRLPWGGQREEIDWRTGESDYP